MRNRSSKPEFENGCLKTAADEARLVATLSLQFFFVVVEKKLVTGATI